MFHWTKVIVAFKIVLSVEKNLIVMIGFLMFKANPCEVVPIPEDMTIVLVSYHIGCGILPPQDLQWRLIIRKFTNLKKPAFIIGNY